MANTQFLTLDSLAAQSNDGLTLLNVSHCPHVASAAALRHFAAMLGRLDDPSHWLVWTKRKVLGPDDKGGEIDVIELPRLGLAFRAYSETAVRLFFWFFIARQPLSPRGCDSPLRPRLVC